MADGAPDGSQDMPANPGTMVTVRFLQDCDSFVGADGLTYPKDESGFAVGDLVSMTEVDAKNLEFHGACTIMPQFTPLGNDEKFIPASTLQQQDEDGLYESKWYEQQLAGYEGQPEQCAYAPECFYEPACFESEPDDEGKFKSQWYEREFLAESQPEPIVIHYHHTPAPIWSDQNELDYIKNLPKAEFVRTNSKKEEIPNAVRFADYIRGKFSTVVFNANIFVFDAIQGIYKPDKGEVDRTIELLLEKIECNGDAINIRREVRAHLLSKNIFAIFPFNYRTDLVPFSNCCAHYNPQTGTWNNADHDRKSLFTYQIPVEFIPNLDTEPVDDLFREWVNEDDVSILYQAPAQGILQAILKQPFKKAYLLKGERDSAKSTYLNLVTRGIGSQNISRVSLQRLGVRFSLASLEGKLLNVFDDLPGVNMRDIGRFNCSVPEFLS